MTGTFVFVPATAVCLRVIPLMIPHGEQARGRCDAPDVTLYFFFLLCIPLLPPRTEEHINPWNLLQ